MQLAFDYIDFSRTLARLHQAAKFRKPIIMYHGTSSKFLRSIMINGIVPNPKEKTWALDADYHSGNQDSRISLAGSYWTSNFMTASSAAHNTMLKFGGKKLLIIAQINEQSGLADEDSIKSYVKEAIVTMAHQIFPGIMADAYVLFMYTFAEKPELYKKAGEIFAAALHKYLIKVTRWNDDSEYNIKIPFDQIRLIKIFQDYLLKPIAYYKASIDKREYNIYRSDIETIVEKGIKIPSVQEADEAVLQDWNWLTTRYRATAFKPTSGYNMHTMRNLLPIGFRGNNRILAIVQENDLEKTSEGLQYYNTTEKDGKKYHVRYPLTLFYGKVPQEFIEQWKERIGDWRGTIPPTAKLIPELKLMLGQ
jgi:hypothetical protein